MYGRTLDEYAMDALYDAVAEKGHVCAGLDTSPSYLPPRVLKAAASPVDAVLGYNKALVDATADVCACYKVQIAYYEAMGLSGLRAYAETLRYIREKHCMVIADIKRGDIADTAAQYAKAHFSGDFEADFVTLSPYMGMDTFDPWLEYTKNAGKGAFVLMRTSNAGMRDFEVLELKEGGMVYSAVAEKLSELAEKYAGRRGYGAFGAVVGCTDPSEAAAIRRRYPSLFFLIPGYGAQGGGANGAALLLRRDGTVGGTANGGVVNASRSILKAWEKAAESAELPTEQVSIDFAVEAARSEAARMRSAIKDAAEKV